MKRVLKPENTGTPKSYQSGFTVIETLMFLTIVVLIGAAGWLVHKGNNKSNPVSSVSSHAKKSSSGNSHAHNQSQYAGWHSFCSGYGGLCLKYPANWTYSPVTYSPGQNTNGQEIDTIASPSSNTVITYMPGAQVSGERRQEIIKVVGVTPTSIPNIEVVGLIDQLTGQPTQYAVEDFVTLISAAHAVNKTASPFTAGATINANYEPPYHQFTSPQRPTNIGQQLLAVTQSGGNASNNIFSSNNAAQAWLNSADVKTAGQILGSVTYSQ